MNNFNGNDCNFGQQYAQFILELNRGRRGSRGHRRRRDYGRDENSPQVHAIGQDEEPSIVLPRFQESLRTEVDTKFQESLRREVDANVEVNLESFKDLPLATQKRIETALRSEINIRIWNTKERDFYKALAQESKFKEHNLEVLVKSLNVKLRARKTIEQKEQNLFPHWLLCLDISRKQKWEIYLHFGLSPEATILVKKIYEHDTKIDLFALSVQELYDKWSCENHEIEELELNENDKDWDLLYKDLGINLERQKIGLRLIVEKLFSNVPAQNYSSNNGNGYVFLKNINWFAQNSEIMSFCQSNGINVKNILHLKDARNREIGTVVLHVDNVDSCCQVFKTKATSFCAPNKTISIINSFLSIDN